MRLQKFQWLVGGVLGLFLSVSIQISLTFADPNANPNPGKVVFKSAHTNYEYEVGNKKESQGEESRRITIAIRPVAAASENTAVEVKVRKSFRTSAEDNPSRLRSNEVDLLRQENEREKRKRDCRGLPWPFVNAVNATNCLDLDEDEESDFSPRLISGDSRDYDDEDATIVLPKKSKGKKKKRRGGKRRKFEDDFIEDYPLDPFHRSMPQARTYHEYAMMLRETAPPVEDFLGGAPPQSSRSMSYSPPVGEPMPYSRGGGPITYGDWNTRYQNRNSQGWAWPSTTTQGWGWKESTTTTTTESGWGWKESTTSSPSPESTTREEYGSGQRGGYGINPSFGQPSQLQQVPGSSFGKPSNPQQGVPVPTLGKRESSSQQTPSTASQQQQQSDNRQGKALLQFGQPSQQQIQVPTPVVQPLTKPQNFLVPAYYAQQTTAAPTLPTNTPPPFRSQQQIIQPNPSIYPILQNSLNQSVKPSPSIQKKPFQPMNKTEIAELYNKLLGLYKILINDSSGGQPPPRQTGPPEPNPWQVPPPQEVWSGLFPTGRGEFGRYDSADIMPGIGDSDSYMFDPWDQPKLLPRPISPVARRKQMRRKLYRKRNEDTEEIIGPRVSFMRNEPTILREINNNEEFLPRRRYFKRKIDDKDLTLIKDDTKKRRQWGRPSRDDYDAYNKGFPRQFKQPGIPAWLRHERYSYRPPVYGPPPENGWGTQAPTTEGWVWKEGWTTEGWGKESTTESTTTTERGWQESTTEKQEGWSSSTTQSPSSNQDGEQQNSAMPTEEGPRNDREYLQQQFWILQQQLLEQLKAIGKLPPEYQNQQSYPGFSPPQGQQYQPGYVPPEQPSQQQQYPLPQPSFGNQGQSLQPQFIQQPSVSPQQIQQTPTPKNLQTDPTLDPVIEDIGRKDTFPVPAFRGQTVQYDANQNAIRQSAARQLFNEGGRSIVSTVTSTSVSIQNDPEDTKSLSTISPIEVRATNGESGNDEKSPVLTAQTQTGTTQQQVSTALNNSSSVVFSSSIPSAKETESNNKVYSSNSTPAVRQLRYLPSSTGEPSPRMPGAPSWGSWGGSYSPTYSKVQNSSQPYRILKRIAGGDPGRPGFIETSLGQAKKVNAGEIIQQGQQKSLVRRIFD